MLHRDETYRTLATHLIEELARIEERINAADILHRKIHDVAGTVDDDCPVEAPIELAYRSICEARRECKRIVDMQVDGLRPIGEVAELWRAAAALDAAG